MNVHLLARIVVGVRTGSLVLTVAEATTIAQQVPARAAVIVDGRPVEIHAIPWHVLPDEPSHLPELDPWRAGVHESLVDGLIDAGDHARLFELAAEKEAEQRREAAELYGRFTFTPEAVAELRRAFGLDDA